MAWLKDIAWIKIGISAAAALVGFFLVNGLSYWMITRSRRYPTGERVKSIQAFNASVVLYLAIDFLLLVNVLLAQDIGSTVKPRAAFFAIFLVSTFLSMMISRANVPIAPRLVPWIWLLLSASTAAILLNKGWFGAPDPRLSAWTSAGLHRQAYNFILAYAVNEHSFALGTQPRGAHLLPHAGFNQFAITYRLEGL
jgi:hypothetical protein